ncbi:MAG: YkgJ family cysteine cluster protein [Thermoplasmatota archaeon]
MADPQSTDASLAALARRIDFRECGPCGGKCCKVGWTVFASPRDMARLERATGRDRREFAEVKPLPEWEAKEFGEGNLLYPRVRTAAAHVPQLKKRPDGSCVFLSPEGSCSVHGAAPLMCRLFPFYYQRSPWTEGETPSPLRTAKGGLRLLVDRGHAGFCPITTERIGEVEREAGDAAVALAEEFDADVARYEREKEKFVEDWTNAE